MVVLLILVSSIPCFLVKEVIVASYEERAVAWRTAEIQEQCIILSNQLAASNYLDEPISEVIDAEISQFSNIYNGRVMIVDDNFRVVKDTFGSDEGRTVIAPDVITCFSGSGTFCAEIRRNNRSCGPQMGSRYIRYEGIGYYEKDHDGLQLKDKRHFSLLYCFAW
jgi:hypothetical protein